MKKANLISAVAVIAIFAVVAAFGCSRTKTIDTEEGKITLTEKGDTFKIETDEGTLTMKGGEMKIKTEKGDAQIAYGKAKLPANISKDIPIYKPSDVAMSQVLDGGKNVILSLSTKDSTAKVKKFYEDAMTKNGWKINRRMNMGPATVLSGSKGPSKLNVTMNQEEGGTVISLAFEGK
jgi:hypothetical protein